MLDEHRALAERRADALGLAREEARPGRVVVDELDRPRDRFELADGNGSQLRFSLRHSEGPGCAHRRVSVHGRRRAAAGGDLAHRVVQLPALAHAETLICAAMSRPNE